MVGIDPFDSLTDNDFTTYLEMHKREMRGPYMSKGENKALRDAQRRQRKMADMQDTHDIERRRAHQ